MKERPILFNAEMVYAILEGRKTQTRRIVKPQPVLISRKGSLFWSFNGTDLADAGQDWFLKQCPYGQPGDQLWVRESCRAEELSDGKDVVRYFDGVCIPIENSPESSEKWLNLYSYNGKRGATVPSIHMPRWASRITLEITNVRVERLQDISEEDALKEGVFGDECLIDTPHFSDQPTPKMCFAQLWDSIYSAPKPQYKCDENGNRRIVKYVSYPWEDIRETREYRSKPWIVNGNPWLVVVEFKRI